jgi:DNA-directed RNA polymerase alpha subunit
MIKVTNYVSKGNLAEFDVKDVGVSLLNALRRTVMVGVPAILSL